MNYYPDDILLEKYRIAAMVGQGVFTQVYRVVDVESNQSRVLKVLHRHTPGLKEKDYFDYKERFRVETSLSSKLNSPNLVKVYEFQEKDDKLFLVLEDTKGSDLAREITSARLTKQNIPVNFALNMAVDVCDGLIALHSLYFVHSNLKPSNIFFDLDQSAKLTDLGLLQVPGVQREGKSPINNPRSRAYSSPEQESSEYLSPASDIYSLGLILFETLTGHLYRSLPSGARVSTFRSDVPGWLDDIIVKMLAKDQQKRPSDGEELAEILRKNMYQGGNNATVDAESLPQ